MLYSNPTQLCSREEEAVYKRTTCWPIGSMENDIMVLRRSPGSRQVYSSAGPPPPLPRPLSFKRLCSHFIVHSYCTHCHQRPLHWHDVILMWFFFLSNITVCSIVPLFIIPKYPKCSDTAQSTKSTRYSTVWCRAIFQWAASTLVRTSSSPSSSPESWLTFRAS